MVTAMIWNYDKRAVINVSSSKAVVTIIKPAILFGFTTKKSRF